MPVADVWVVFEVFLESDHFFFIWHVLESASGFYGEGDAYFFCFFCDFFKSFNGAGVVEFSNFGAFLDEFVFEFIVFFWCFDIYFVFDHLGDFLSPFFRGHGD